jgi:MFS family permease
MWKRYLSRLPPTDRATFVRDLPSGVLWGAGSGLVVPLVSVIARKLGMPTEIMAVMLAMPFAGSLFSMYIGHFTERRPKMPLVVWPGVLGRGLFLLVPFVRGPTGFFLIVSLFYLVISVMGPAYAAIMRSNYTDANRGRLMGDIRVAMMLVSAISSWAGGAILQAAPESYRWLFPTAGVLGVLSLLVFGRIPVSRDRAGSGGPPGSAHAPAEAHGGTAFLSSLRHVGRDRDFLLFLGALFLCAFPDKMLVPLEPIRLVDELGVDYHSAGLILGTASSVAGIAGYWFWGRISRRGRPLGLFVAILAVMALRLPFFAMAGVPVHLIPWSVLGGFSGAGFDILLLLVILRLAAPERFTLSYGMNSTLVGVRGILGPILGTVLYANGLLTIAQVAWLATALTFAGIGCMALLDYSIRRRERAAPAP